MARTFYDLLNSNYDYDCGLEIGGVDMPADLVWDAGDRVTPSGRRQFRELMDSEAHYDEDNNCIIVDGPEKSGEKFAWAAAGYVSDKLYHVWFHIDGDVSPCDCGRCDRKDCIHREAARRNLESEGGLELCPLFKEL